MGIIVPIKPQGGGFFNNYKNLWAAPEYGIRRNAPDGVRWGGDRMGWRWRWRWLAMAMGGEVGKENTSIEL